MLVYLDTAQIAWIERADDSDRDRFLQTWRACGCELAVSMQILQEVVKLGSLERGIQRSELLLHLVPLRGIPASAAGVMVREAAIQLKVPDIQSTQESAWIRDALFPALPADEVAAILRGWEGDLRGFNTAAELSAEAEIWIKASAKLGSKKKHQVTDWNAFREQLRNDIDRHLSDAAEREVLRAISDAVVSSLELVNGDIRAAKIRQWGLGRLECISAIRDEDLSGAAAFVEAAEFAAGDIAAQIGVPEPRVHELIAELHPYKAPGYALAMAHARARRRHTASPKSSDKTDEEHIVFAPYVDLHFVDRRSHALIREEVRRGDGRIPARAERSIRKAKDLEAVRMEIELLRTQTSHGT